MAGVPPLVGSTEVFVTNNGFGGDFQLDETGDLVLAIDTSDNPAATQQRIVRLLYLSARKFDQYGNAVGNPDDIFHPDYGAGLPSRVDELLTQDVLDDLTTLITSALVADPSISSNPAPSMAFCDAFGNILSDSSLLGISTNAVYIVITYTSILGQTYTLPSISLSPGAGL